MGRFEPGQSVWISPGSTNQYLIDDEATVIDDLDTGYIVLQESELMSSHGMGHYVRDSEVRPW